MSRRAERLANLGAATVAELHRRVDAAPAPPPEVIEELRRVLAPALQRTRARRARELAQQSHSAAA